MVWIDGVVWSTELLGNSLTSWERTTRLCVSVVLLGVNNFDDCLVDYFWQLESICSAWLSKAQIDHWKFMVRVGLHLTLKDLSDRVVHIRALCWLVFHLGP